MIPYLYNLGKCFSHVAGASGQHIALKFSVDQTFTYSFIERFSNRLAHWLLALGVKKNDVVCITGRKSAALFGMILGCLKIGAIYAIVDPQSPAVRLRRMLENCLPALLIGDMDFLAQHAALLGELNIPVEPLDDETLMTAVENLSDQIPACTPTVTGTDPAYIMFTSGSTGFPKAAVITHANVLNLIQWSRTTYKITRNEIFTNVNPLHFDNSVFDFYAALFNGAALVPFSREETVDPLKLVEKVGCLKCTSWFSVPSLLIFLQTMKALDGRRLSSIKRFIFGGEGYPKARLKKFFDAYNDKAGLFNVYGPTECTCICSSYQITEDDFEDLNGLPSLGMAAPNFDYLLLDNDGFPVAEGEIGEICLLGPQVGKGYYNDNRRTAQSFIQNPMHHRYSDIIYKTGDLARVNKNDGKLCIHGRKDNQIKHMGYRIELEEIENAMHLIPDVFEAAAFQEKRNGNSFIAVALGTAKDLDKRNIQRHLREYLPPYMIPSKIQFFSALPKNRNGKVDRRAIRSMLQNKE